MSEQYIYEKLNKLQKDMQQMQEPKYSQAMDVVQEFGTACLCGADDETINATVQRFDAALEKVYG